VSFSSGVWGGSPAVIEFGAFLPENMTSCGKNFDYIPENQLTAFGAA